jgi:uncharacterized membrane protein YhaH (DUF805 family)
MGWYREVFRRAGDFEGRSRRSEFWVFTGISTTIAAVLLGLDIGTGILATTRVGILFTAYALVAIVPQVAVGCRRLHDIGRSGWWQLAVVVPVVGIVVLIVFWATRGDHLPNRYGVDPIQRY